MVRSKSLPFSIIAIRLSSGSTTLMSIFLVAPDFSRLSENELNNMCCLSVLDKPVFSGSGRIRSPFLHGAAARHHIIHPHTALDSRRFAVSESHHGGILDH